MNAPKEEIMLFLLSVYDVKAAAMQLYHIFLGCQVYKQHEPVSIFSIQP